MNSEELEEAVHRIVVTVGVTSEEFEQGLKKVIAAFVVFGDAVEVFVDEFSKSMARLSEEIKETFQEKEYFSDSFTRPDEYGMRLIREQRYASSRTLYNFKPAPMRNLPYQRRNY